MRVREMTIDDISAVAELEARDSRTPWSETSLFTYFLRDDSILLVGEEDGKGGDDPGEPGLVGFTAMLTAPPESDILDVTVAGSFRRRGYGEELLVSLFGEARKRGVNTVWLEVRTGNAPARALYGKLGFRETGIRKNYYTDPVEDGITMRLTINGQED